MDKQKIWDQQLQKKIDKQGFINICHEALDTHLPQYGSTVAIRYINPDWVPGSDAVKDITYQELAEDTCRFAHALQSLGIKKGDVLFSFIPRVPELYTVALGTLRLGAVFSPLFAAFGPEPILSRMKKGKAKVLFSSVSLFKKKVLPILDSIPTLEKIILIDDDGTLKDIDGVIDFHELIRNADPVPFIEKTHPDDMALLHFTSGTTGEPKGAIHVHKAVIYHKFSGEFALDLKAGDLFWCTADPGWVTGTSYGIISPLCNGATMLIDGAEFSAVRWYEILSRFKVNIWYTAPTALRMLMRAGEELPLQYNFRHVRFASSVGEPLNPEVIEWVQEHLKIKLHDNWWQTETGGIMICNYPKLPVRLGSMGKPIPGIEVKLIDGEIAIKKGWPSMFQGYLEAPERYAKCFSGEWYLSGDLARMDSDGHFWFVGRKDDVIKTSGHLIGPFEVENVLMEQESVLESAVIGVPDPVVGEMIKAFVVLKKNFIPSSEQRQQILSYARKKLGVAVAPREIQFIDNLPKTRSGKIMRRLLKARELGLPEGDLSTLENPDAGP